MYENFAKLLNERGITPYRVHKATGVAQSTLSDWKNGKCTPGVDKLKKIADFFGVSIDYLMTGKTDQKEKAPTKVEAEDDPLKHALIALYGDHEEITEDILDDARAFIEFKMSQKKNKK